MAAGSLLIRSLPDLRTSLLDAVAPTSEIRRWPRKRDMPRYARSRSIEEEVITGIHAFWGTTQFETVPGSVRSRWLPDNQATRGRIECLVILG